MSTIVLWMLVINLGIAFGAGLYEDRIVAPRWLAVGADASLHWHGDVARRDDTGRRFWGFVTTVPLTLLTLANLYASWVSAGDARLWWLTAAVATSGERLMTVAYFIPVMVRLMKATDSPRFVAIATRWRRLNYLRHGLVAVAWAAALRAVALQAGR
jgi:hypothetical protein